MVGRLGVHQYVSGAGARYNPKEYNLLTMYDIQARAYRQINLETVFEVKFKGGIYCAK